MTDKIVYTPNDDKQIYPFCRIKLVVEKFEHSTLWTNQSKFKSNEKVNVIKDFVHLSTEQPIVPSYPDQ